MANRGALAKDGLIGLEFILVRVEGHGILINNDMMDSLDAVASIRLFQYEGRGRATTTPSHEEPSKTRGIIIDINRMNRGSEGGLLRPAGITASPRG